MMAKRLKFDESGDSEDLQALFDSLSDDKQEPPKPSAPPPVQARPASTVASSASGDNDELQALFDSVIGTCASFSELEPDLGASEEGKSENSSEVVFNRIGHMTRNLHDTIRELGYDRVLEDTAKGIPDARQRLTYIATKTEEAASRVLNATDIAKPIQDSLHDRSMLLSRRWDKVFNNEMSRDDFKRLAEETRAFLKDVPQQANATNEQLMEIMMAQDFQDLTGQVIKKVVDLAQSLEAQLLQILVETIPDNKRPDAPEGLMNGPVINPEGRADIVANQEQVDELLESLGF